MNAHVKKVKQQAMDIKDICEEFFQDFKSEKEKNDFRKSFHLRPTSSNGTTIVSTMAIAPMRGISVSPKELESKLQKIRAIVAEPCDDEKLNLMKKIGFKQRGIKKSEREEDEIEESELEEDVQAALIRKLILSPEKLNNMQFVASEFNLYKKKRADVLAFKDGVLYVIEIKKERESSAVEQTDQYVKYIGERLSEYADCLAEFPNCKIGKIEDVRGIALLPYNKNSSGELEKACKEFKVELQFFERGGYEFRPV